ncbi:hypothetical protein D3C85_1877270 [compost metagenome]
MDHDWAVLLTVFPRVFKLEAFWQQEIDLRSRKCFFLLERSLDLNIKLRTIERRFAFCFIKWQA